MDWERLLESIMYGFQATVGSQNFTHLLTYVRGLMFCEQRHRVSDIHLAGKGHRSYWALVKFVGRGKWDLDKLSAELLRLLFCAIPERLYVYDHTHAIKTGNAQYGLHFFRNHRARLRNTNQSKFHWGHQFAG